ncbi:MAG: hypothetical protein AAGM40_24895 [Cyanobacteria bacterium J06573_2]
MRLPYWLPNLRSCVNAVALILLMIGIGNLITRSLDKIIELIHAVPWLSGIIVLLIFLFPIVAITFLHHWFHTFLDIFFPQSRIPGDEAQAGWFPSIISWWEGIYGWSVNVLSGLLVFFILSALSFSDYSSHMLSILGEMMSKDNSFLPSLRFTVLQMIVAACLYQLEYLVQQHLVAAARR